MNLDENQNRVAGIWFALLAYTAWGFLPLFWKTLQEVPAWEILAHRIVWSLVFVAVVLMINGGWRRFGKFLSHGKTVGVTLISGVLISLNWVTYIWAVNSDHVVEASLGYYMTPLFNVLLGVVVLKERLNFWQMVSFVMAGIGVAILTIHYGSLPWVALVLTFTFGLYGLVKKTVQVDSVMALALETLLVTPAALFYLGLLHSQGNGVFLGSMSLTLLLMAAGVATAAPLLFFSMAAKRIPLSMIGFFQYLAPSISLVLGVFWFHEPFTLAHLFSFGFIWVGLILYTFSHHRRLVRLQPGRFKQQEHV